MPGRSLAQLYRDEFRGYSPAKFRQNLLASLTVVAMALALVFGVASGATAAAGMVTAILAGLLSGAQNFFWSSDQAIVEAQGQGCKFCENQSGSTSSEKS